MRVRFTFAGGTGPAEPMVPVARATLGTVFPLECGDLLARLLAGIATLPVDVAATTGRDVDPAELGPQPPNVRLDRWLPRPRCCPRWTWW